MSVLVALPQTSEASVPNVVSERVPAAQTAVATSVVSVPKLLNVLPVAFQTATGSAAILAPKEEDAARTFELVVVMFVFAVLIFVFAVASEDPRLVDAAKTVESV